MRITLVADNSTSPNWGCRATSFALREILSSRHDIVGTVTRELLKGPLTHQSRISGEWHRQAVLRLHRPRLLKLPLVGAATRLFLDGLGRYHVPGHDVDKEADILWNARESSPKARAIHAAIAPCDAIVVNAEGEAIFSTPARPTLLQTLAICELARRMGKDIHWVNGMLSADPDTGQNLETIALTRSVLADAHMTVRDPLSQDAARDWLPNKAAPMVPDALFSWARYFRDDAAKPYDVSRLAAWFDRTGTSRPRCTDQPYIVLSGSSLSARHQGRAAKCYTMLATGLKKLGLPVLLVETCIGDQFLRSVARDTDLPLLDVNTPIMAGAATLANARLFVSGRWHPGIMASLGGTPQVVMGSNSHKTRALQIMLGADDAPEYDAFPEASTCAAIVETAAALLGEGLPLRQRTSRRAEVLCAEVPRLLEFIA